MTVGALTAFFQVYDLAERYYKNMVIEKIKNERSEFNDGDEE